MSVKLRKSSFPALLNTDEGKRCEGEASVRVFVEIRAKTLEIS